MKRSIEIILIVFLAIFSRESIAQPSGHNSDTALMVINERPYWIVFSASSDVPPASFEGSITKATQANSDFVKADSIDAIWVEKYTIINTNLIAVDSLDIEKYMTIDREVMADIFQRGEEVANKHLTDQKKLERRVKIIGISIIIATPIVIGIIDWLRTPLFPGGFNISL